MKKEKKNINPLFGNQKRIKSVNFSSDDDNIIKKFIITVVIIVLLVGIVYGATELFKKKDNNVDVTQGEVNYNIVTIGMLLNRPEKEYYVVIYDQNDSNAVMYSAMISNYANNNGKLKVYYCDLSNKLNSSYYNINNDNKSNPDAKKISELDLGDLTLIKVSNGKIVKYLENYEDIKSYLK